MKLKTNPHKSDQLFLSKEDIDQILDGGTLRIGALDIKLQKPDIIDFLYLYSEENVTCTSTTIAPNLKLTFDVETGKLKSAELL